MCTEEVFLMVGVVMKPDKPQWLCVVGGAALL